MQTTQLYQPTEHTLAGAPLETLTYVISSELTQHDRQALLDLFARSSPQTRRDRFHHALSVFPQRYLEEILDGRKLALAARDTCHPESYGKVFGLASAAPTGPGTAEFTVWVDDAWQGCGVGSLLTGAVLGLLARAGTHTATGIVESDNIAVRRMISKVAPHATTYYEDGVIVVCIPLAEWASGRSVQAVT